MVSMLTVQLRIITYNGADANQDGIVLHSDPDLSYKQHRSLQNSNVRVGRTNES
jgi:hypothetical protein